MKGETIDGAAIRMTDGDNVVTALEDLAAGRQFRIDGEAVVLAEDVEFGHKFAVAPFAIGDTVTKYGEVIGEATAPIAVGEWVHTHNVESTRGRPGSDDGADAETVAADADEATDDEATDDGSNSGETA